MSAEIFAALALVTTSSSATIAGSYATVEDRVAMLEGEVQELRARLEQAEQREVIEEDPVRISGYVDVGFFVPSGDGSGVVRDIGGRVVPAAADRWVFLGDLLAPAVNSRGEAADLGDLPGIHRFDSVGSGGALGFIINEVNVAMTVGFGSRALLTVSADVVPRSGDDFDLGDFIELDLAQLEWLVTNDSKTSIFAGKIEPVLGIEYRDRKANRRFGVTPSLIARYTTGTPLGIKARSKLFDDWLIVAASLTNGSSVIEPFHFHDEIDSNDGKTLSGRAALRLPLNRWAETFAGALEIGLSGSAGPQDRARSSGELIWFAGVDLEYSGVDLAIKAQWLRGHSPGSGVDRVYGLDLRHGAYLEVDYLFLPLLGALARIELRDATVALADERLYLTKSWRLTLGARLTVDNHITLKAEFLKNGEYGGLPEVDNDIVTSSLVLSY